MINAKDFAGNMVYVGDRVAYGASNGSTLFLGRVYKITEKKVWVNRIEGDTTRPNFDFNESRDWDRVVLVKRYEE